MSVGSQKDITVHRFDYSAALGIFVLFKSFKRRRKTDCVSWQPLAFGVQEQVYALPRVYRKISVPRHFGNSVGKHSRAVDYALGC